MFLSVFHTDQRPLTRILSRFALPCVAVLTAAIFLARRQASGDATLRVLLLPPPACAAPCFLGIRPGVTTVDAVLEQLRANPLIQSISPVSSYPGDSPLAGLYDVEFALTDSSIRTIRMQLITQPRNTIIEEILIFDMGSRLSDITLALGNPLSLILDDQFHTGVATYVGFYPQYHMHVHIAMAVCSLELDRLWNERQSIVIGIDNERRFVEEPSYYPAEAYQSGAEWVHQLYEMKQVDCT